MHVHLKSNYSVKKLFYGVKISVEVRYMLDGSTI